MEIGVVIGRFQTPYLHEGHTLIIDKAIEHAHKTLVCVGVSDYMGTERNPLDYPTIERMIKAKYPDVIVMPLPDKHNDEEWTKALNEMIALLFPNDTATIYCGRINSEESVQGGYKGPHRLQTYDKYLQLSATDLRSKITVCSSEDFRRGVIYATKQLSNKICKQSWSDKKTD